MEAAKLRQVSYQDVLDAPDGMRAEIIDGEFVLQARPMPAHDCAMMGLIDAISAPFQRGRGGPGGWWIIAEPELSFGNPDFRTLVPDLAGWRRERMPEIKPDERYSVAPDWVCEILSPSTARIDRVHKTRIYAEEGIANLWIVDPDEKTIEIYALRDGHWSLIAAHDGVDEIAAQPFEDAPFHLGDLWLPTPITDEEPPS